MQAYLSDGVGDPAGHRNVGGQGDEHYFACQRYSDATVMQVLDPKSMSKDLLIACPSSELPSHA